VLVIYALALSHRRTFKRIAFVVYVLVATLVGLELIFRLFDPLGLFYYADAKRYFSELVIPDPDFHHIHGSLAYINRPHASLQLRTMHVEINGQGFRWTDFPQTTESNKTRILILGDSIVFGWGVPVEQIFASQIQQLEPSFEILAAGVPSWNTRSEYEWFKVRGITYKPDIVLWIVATNDVLPHSPNLFKEPSSRIARYLRASYLLHLVRTFSRLTFSAELIVASFAQGSSDWEDAKSALESMVDLCQTQGVILLPVLYSDLNSEFARVFYDNYNAVLHRHDVEFHRFPDSIYEHRNSRIDHHPNGTGHKLMAQYLIQLLKRRS
jgi:hypothetical protein